MMTNDKLTKGTQNIKINYNSLGDSKLLLKVLVLFKFKLKMHHVIFKDTIFLYSISMHYSVLMMFSHFYID